MNTYLKKLSLVLPLAMLSACKNEITPEWETYYSHVYSDESRVEWLSNIAVDSYGDIISGGSTIRTGADREQNVLFVKQNAEGDLVWSRDFDLGEGQYRSDDKVSDLVLDEEGNIYATGVRYIVEDDVQRYGSFLVKIDSAGELIWKTELSDHEDARDIEIHDDKLYVTGFATQVFNLDGELQLFVEHERAWDIEVDNAGNFHVAGAENVSKYNAAGELNWSVELAADLYHQASLVVLSDGGVVVAHNHQDDTTRVMGIDANGVSLWAKSYSQSRQSNGLPGPALLEADWRDNVVLSLSNDRARRIVKFDDTGRELWQVSSQGILQDLHLGGNGEVYAVGGGVNEKYGSEGELLGTTNATPGTQITTGSIAIDGENMYLGYSAVESGNIQLYLAKYLDR